MCRDAAGIYLGASGVVFLGVTDPATLEVLSCWEALALATDLSLMHIEVASDCKELVNV